MEKGTEIATQGETPTDMISMALSKGADLVQLEKLLDIKERYEALEAKKAYVKAMAEFKKNPPKIQKDKNVSIPHKNDNGFTKYSHASLANVSEKINAGLSLHGLSAAWSTQQNGQILVTCKITHEKGHSEETTLSAPADNTGSKNPIQQIGSTITYLQRYTLLSLVGLATEGQDDDGKGSEPVVLISEEQCVTIDEYIASTNANKVRFLKHMGVEKVEDIPVSQYQKAINVFDERNRK